MIVVDAGVVVAALTGAPDLAEPLRRELSGQRLTAPSLVDVEVLSALRGLHRGGHLSDVSARGAVADLRTLPIDRHDHVSLLTRCWQLRDNLTIYDASYVALAELFSVELWTTDRRIPRAPGPRCQIRLVQ